MQYFTSPLEDISIIGDCNMESRTIFERRDKVNYYLDLAEVVGERATCIRRHFGAVIVKDDEVISTGYVGAPRGRANCNELGYCVRENLKVPRGERYELCRSVHAEANAIISAARSELLGSSLYLVGKEVRTGEYVRDTKDDYRLIDVNEWIENDESLEGVFGY
jgi:dCMP deaminase